MLLFSVSGSYGNLLLLCACDSRTKFGLLTLISIFKNLKLSIIISSDIIKYYNNCNASADVFYNNHLKSKWFRMNVSVYSFNPLHVRKNLWQEIWV